MKICERCPLPIYYWRMGHALTTMKKKIRYHEYFFPSAALVEQLLVFQFFFQNVHLKSRVLYTDYLCKIIDQKQGLFNFDRFVYNFGQIYCNTVQILISVQILYIKVKTMSGNINNIPAAHVSAFHSSTTFFLPINSFFVVACSTSTHNQEGEAHVKCFHIL